MLENEIKDVLITGKVISKIGNDIGEKTDCVIDGSNKAIIPAFVNAHTHSAMTHFRGYGDDMKLMEWLQTKIWPNETRLTEELVYHGARLACLEMIKSGTTFFNDMYWYPRGVAKAVTEMGLRAAVNAVFIDMFDSERAKKQMEMNEILFEEFQSYNERIVFALGPHAIYTVSEESLKWAVDFSRKHELRMHIHLSETEQEVQDSRQKFGMSPVEYLDSLGFLSENVVAAHCIWVSEKDMDILAEREVHVVYNPVSNMKLSVNRHFPYRAFKTRGMNICLGTDGVSSNNNLSMFDTMKTGALLQKHHEDPTVLTAYESFQMATKNGYEGFNLNGGSVEEGKLADVLLIELNIPEMIPCHDLISNLVYSANASCVDTTICNGKVLMRDRKVEGEADILAESALAVKRFLD